MPFALSDDKIKAYWERMILVFVVQFRRGAKFMAAVLKLPVGIEDFRDIRRLGFYYVDKTELIEQLLDNWGKVNLFTRPRRRDR